MIKCKLIVLGSLKEKYLAEACREYEKRLSRYCSLETYVIEPVRLPEKPSNREIEAALQKEAELILKKIPENSRIIALCVEGEPYSSEGFAQLIKSDAAAGKTLVFIIGSSYGLSECVKNAADKGLSLSKMTFPHQLFRVMLLEQIYRAFKINEGSAYHK
ncbi:MAG: 23S rRNA (pseudouridine(1915)-N(3))-methyltransferase RlmH [Acutalibacteraceae bacterium]